MIFCKAGGLSLRILPDESTFFILQKGFSVRLISHQLVHFFQRIGFMLSAILKQKLFTSSTSSGRVVEKIT
jgi:hypothetical protein